MPHVATYFSPEWFEAHVASLIRAVLIPVVTYVLIRIARGIINRVERLADDGDDSITSEREKRARTLGMILTQVVTVGLWSLAAILVLGEVGVDVKPFLAGAGIIGLAVGFGAQTLVKDLISGFFILFENQMRVNDVVRAAGVSGLVEEINLRTTVLRDNDGTVHIIPNGSITTVSNMTREWARAVLDIGVDGREDADRCLGVLKAVARDLEADPLWSARLRGPFEFPGIEKLEASNVVLRMTVQTRPVEQWNVNRELRRRVKIAFDGEKIRFSRPARDVRADRPA
jgi:moderate conductance mechanosensitive channel